KHTNKGSLNINTNGSNPKAVQMLMDAGLDSIRVSLNSFRTEYYTPYYRPNNYVLQDLLESLKIVTDNGGWASINYFVFPGVTDSVAEVDALLEAIAYTKLNMIQWRNFNIDPDWYLGNLNITDTGECYGMSQIFQIIKDEFPHVKFGYFNPPIERIQGNFEQSFAH
ncbi:MAG TPA: radical SAM protein, partial [Chitinophagaceae bacterium]|nr:radical SAM protein [Chitinophagaceae bacterium]